MITQTDRDLAAKFFSKLDLKNPQHKKQLDATANLIAEHCLAERKCLIDLMARFRQMQQHESWKPVWETAKAQGVFYTGPTMKEPMDAAQELINTYPTPDPMGETQEA